MQLLCETPRAWVQLAIDRFDEVLVDHAHCEKKAAAQALSMLAAFPSVPGLARAMARLAREEAGHLGQVLALMEKRGLRLGRDPGDPYAQGLQALVRQPARERLLDRLIVSALIETRREEMERQGKAPVADRRSPRHSEEILQPRADRGRLAGNVLDAQLPSTRQRDLIWRELVELGRQKAGEHVRFAQLPQRRGPLCKCLGALAHPGVVQRQDPRLRAMLRDQLDPPPQTRDLLGVRES